LKIIFLVEGAYALGSQIEHPGVTFIINYSVLKFGGLSHTSNELSMKLITVSNNFMTLNHIYPLDAHNQMSALAFDFGLQHYP
jgi:hypothetical protein